MASGPRSLQRLEGRVRPATSSFWWPQVFRGRWPHPSHLYLHRQVASSSSVPLLCLALMRTLVMDYGSTQIIQGNLRTLNHICKDAFSKQRHILSFQRLGPDIFGGPFFSILQFPDYRFSGGGGLFNKRTVYFRTVSDLHTYCEERVECSHVPHT